MHYENVIMIMYRSHLFVHVHVLYTSLALAMIRTQCICLFKLNTTGVLKRNTAKQGHQL